jgi:hypothetical protein
MNTAPYFGYESKLGKVKLLITWSLAVVSVEAAQIFWHSLHSK